MSKVYHGSFSYGSTSVNQVLSIPGFTHIDGFEITISAPIATPSQNNRLQYSTCKTAYNPNIPANESTSVSLLFDSTTGSNITRLSETYCTQHFDIDPLTNSTRRVISGTLVGYSTSGSNTSIEIDYDRASNDYKQYITVWGS